MNFFNFIIVFIKIINMLPGLISVGLFWGILIYYVNQGREGPKILPLIKSVLPSKERFLRYVRIRKQRPPTK